MKYVRLACLLLIALCLVSCSTNRSFTLDEINEIFIAENLYFENAASILSENTEFRDHLKNELHLENVYLRGKLAHSEDIFLMYMSSEDISRLRKASKIISPGLIAYTTLNMYDKQNTHPIEAIEFAYDLQDSKYPDPSVCSIFYVDSTEDREFIAENPYRFCYGTTVRLTPLDIEGWYLFLFY